MNAQWILAAPICLIGVFRFNESLKSLWVCLSLFAMFMCPVTIILLRKVDYYIAVNAHKKLHEDKRSIEMTKIMLDEVYDDF